MGSGKGPAAPASKTMPPAQSLLASLQASEALRKERYLGTVTAKMKEAREALPSLVPKHSACGEAAVGREPAAEVHGLLFDVEAKQASEAKMRCSAAACLAPLHLVGPRRPVCSRRSVDAAGCWGSSS
jgi:hypothetical protein